MKYNFATILVSLLAATAITSAAPTSADQSMKYGGLTRQNSSPDGKLGGSSQAGRFSQGGGMMRPLPWKAPSRPSPDQASSRPPPGQVPSTPLPVLPMCCK